MYLRDLTPKYRERLSQSYLNCNVIFYLLLITTQRFKIATMEICLEPNKKVIQCRHKPCNVTHGLILVLEHFCLADFGGEYTSESMFLVFQHNVLLLKSRNTFTSLEASPVVLHTHDPMGGRVGLLSRVCSTWSSRRKMSDTTIDHFVLPKLFALWASCTIAS